MQDSKDITWGRDYPAEDETAQQDGQVSTNSSDSDGWQQYRKWISKAPAPRGRRNGIDPSLYTWKGYRNWTEQVKRNWSDS